MDTIDWLLDSDPAIRWQAMHDLTDASPAAVAAERARVPREGLGAEILAHQGSDGSWRRADAPVWLSTLFTFLLLRATGVDRAEPVVESAVARLEAGLRWDDRTATGIASDGIRRELRSSRAKRSRASTGACSRLAPTSGVRPRASRAVSSASSSMTAAGTARRRRVRARRSTPRSAYWRACSSTSVPSAPRPRSRRPDGVAKSTCSSVASSGGGPPARSPSGVPGARVPAPLPLRHTSCARLLQDAHADVQPDARIGDAMHLVETKRQADGRWLLDRAYDEALALPFGESVGEPSRWNTLRALRVLRWYQRRGLEAASTP